MFDSQTVTFDNNPYHVVPPTGGVDVLPGCSLTIWHNLSDPVTIGGPFRRTFPVPPNYMFPVNEMDPGEYPYLSGPVGQQVELLWQGVPEQTS